MRKMVILALMTFFWFLPVAQNQGSFPLVDTGQVVREEIVMWYIKGPPR
jgi:hypothetical protein